MDYTQKRNKMVQWSMLLIGILVFCCLFCSIATYGQKSATQLVKEGQDLLEAKKYDQARKSLEKAAAIYKQSKAYSDYVDIQLTINKALEKQNKLEVAEFHLRETLRSIQQIQSIEKSLVYDVLKALGINLYELGNYAGAKRQYLKALSILKSFENRNYDQEASMYNRLCNTYRHLFDYSKALEYIQKAVKIAEEHLDESDPDFSGYYHSLGYVYYKQNRVNLAIEYYEKSLQLRIKHFGENHRYVADSYLNISSSYSKKSNFLRALAYLEMALPIYIKHYGRDHTRVASCYNNIGICLRDLGDISQATLYHKAALDLKSAIHGAEHPRLAKYYYNLGVDQEEAGNYVDAKDNFKKSLAIEIENFGEANSKVAGSYGSIGMAEFNLKNYAEALRLLQKGLAIQVASVGESDHYTPSYYSNMSRVNHAMGNKKNALELLTKSIALNKKIHGEFHHNIAKDYAYMAEILLEARQTAEAKSANRKAIIALNPTISSFEALTPKIIEDMPQKLALLDIIEVEAGIAKILSEGTNMEAMNKALSYYQLAIGIMDNLRDNFYLKNAMQHTPQDFMPIYENAIQVALQLEKLTKDNRYINEALTIAEKNKAVMLASNLQDNYAKSFAGVPDNLIQQERDISSDILYVKNRLWEIEKKQETNSQSSLLSELQQQLIVLKSQKDSIINLAESTYPAYYELKFRRKNHSVAEIQEKLLTEKKVLVEYFVGADNIFLFGLGKNEMITKIIKKPKTLNNDIQALRDFLTHKKNDVNQFCSLSHSLYQLLLKPVESLGAFEEITIVTDGFLGYLPFDILIRSTSPDEDNFRNLDYALNSYQISYGFSANYLVENKMKNGKYSEDYLAVAPSFGSDKAKNNPPGILLASNNAIRNSLSTLDYAKNEIKSLAKYIKGNYYEGKLATESIFKADASNYGILHLATHAIVDDTNPMNSRLLFSQENDSLEDGNLHTWELYNMKLNAQMAVLSACNTGYGQIQRGEGVMSIARAFAYAGCPSVVMSLWPAQDKTTADIMDTFYAGLSQGFTKDKALQLAKINFLKNGDELFSHPFYWASFVAQGDQRPLIQTKTFKDWFIYICGGIIFLSIFIVIIKTIRNK